MAKAILFDLDGIIVDSETAHYLAHKNSLKKQGIWVTKKDYNKRGKSREPNLFYGEI